ncbi:RdgB/HAM1 family non-canonical purine NTP pyrophosphatase [Limnoglobus roseus]|uniref:dITP/XTP pyrophosphatase n=1 Tax=Limnoglobus roseus TaxID=2598579 RepID=A0A5C1A8T3_9BACT|nr:RdgB/HAM1 family non-canonical purine NTP pyrophosphatase [Limnoglobus roseus]QEL14603.1 non-canonical purine NTP pyrophosphatase, RdgB/HAM1 family [Limnoglobus roseus]
MPRLVLGSRNKKKLRELVELLSDLVDVTDLTPFANAPADIDETGTTFEENARIKATTLAPLLNEWVIGEDSGLVVPALNGDPGVYSARYAGTHGDDAANNAKLLAAMATFTGEKRAGYYVSTIALADPTGKVVAVVDGRCWGVIGTQPRGDGGFGYDPLFIIPEYHASFGELTSTVKHALSHRGRAVSKLRPLIRSHILAATP